MRAASDADREQILDVCTAAFVSEPAFRHFFRDAYDPHARSFLGCLLDVRLAGGIVWVGEVDGRIASASMWDPPGGNRLPQDDQDRMWFATMAAFPADAAARLDSYDERVHGLAPTTEHYYLGILASDPELRGRGHGGAALKPGLAAADAENLPTFLETGTESNLGFYAHFGFEVTGELELDGGTRVWCLTRPPNASLG